MTKAQKIVISTLLAISAILFVVVLAWQPCQYALIVPSLFAFVGFTTWIVAAVKARKNKKANVAINA